MKNSIQIKYEESKNKTITRFCFLTALLASPYIFILGLTGMYLSSAVMTLLILLFISAAYLNKKEYTRLARVLILALTNFAVFYFTMVLGFNSGIRLYLFSSPLIVYLLFDFSETKKILLALGSYMINFLLLFVISHSGSKMISPLSEDTQSLLFNVNFAFALILCFTLIIYFANNNTTYFKLLVSANESLTENKALLEKEIHEKNEAHAELLKTLKEKEILLQEIHHRVKNNLAVISGLVELQNFYIKDEKASAILKESRNRIKSIAVLHEKFYETKSLDKIEIRAYVDELIYFIQLSFSSQNKEIKIHTQIDFIEFSLADALPFSLLLNELITNSYKHAFTHKEKGNIYISLIKKGNDVVFHFKDDGDGFDYANFVKENTLGMNLVEAFSNQLKGKMTYSSKEGIGIDYTLHFKLL